MQRSMHPPPIYTIPWAGSNGSVPAPAFTLLLLSLDQPGTLLQSALLPHGLTVLGFVSFLTLGTPWCSQHVVPAGGSC